MKIVIASNGKQTVKMSKVEWQSIGKKAGWMKEAQDGFDNNVEDLTANKRNQEMNFKKSKLITSIENLLRDFESEYHEWVNKSCQMLDSKGASELREKELRSSNEMRHSFDVFKSNIHNLYSGDADFDRYMNEKFGIYPVKK